MYSFSYLEPVCCSMSSSNCCFLTYIQVSQEAGQVVLYAHLFQNFPQFIVIHTVKGFGIVNKAEIVFFWNSLAFSMIQRIPLGSHQNDWLVIHGIKALLGGPAQYRESESHPGEIGVFSPGTNARSSMYFALDQYILTHWLLQGSRPQRLWILEQLLERA